MAGPAVAPAFIRGIEQRVVSSLGLDAEGEIVTSARTVLYSGTWRLLEQGPRGAQEMAVRLLSPGHCIETAGGGYAQVLLLNVHGPQSPPASETASKMLVSLFEPASQRSKLHPELPLPWLRRVPAPGGLQIIPVSTAVRRAHIYPLFRGEADGGEACECYPSTFLVNLMALPLVIGPPDRRPTMPCQSRSCVGRLVMPSKQGPMSSARLVAGKRGGYS